MSDAFLDTLTTGLKPVKPMRMWPLWAGAGIALIVAVLYIWFLYHPRVELRDLVMHGTWPTNPVAIVKPLLFLALGVSALWAISGLARPQGDMKLRYLLPVLVLGGIVMGNLISEIMVYGWEDIAGRLNGGVTDCFLTILCGGMAGHRVVAVVAAEDGDIASGGTRRHERPGDGVPDGGGLCPAL